MNNDQQAEDAKLREVYDTSLKETLDVFKRNPKVYQFGFTMFKAGAEWQSQQSVEKVDVEKLTNDLYEYLEMNTSFCRKIVNWFLPHLQPAVEETSDAVDWDGFDRWLKCNFEYSGRTDLWHNIHKQQGEGWAIDGLKSVYTEFKNQIKKG